MPLRSSEIRSLRVNKPAEWVLQIKRAVRDSNGFLNLAAKHLGISRRTLQRWINTDDRLKSVRALIAPAVVPPMSNRISQLGALRISTPDAWVHQVTRAVRDTEGYLGDAAERLGISRRTLQRWINTDDRLESVRTLVASSHRPD